MGLYNKLNYIPVVDFKPSSSFDTIKVLDLLKAEYIPMLKLVNHYTLYQVTDVHESHPELISFKHYGTIDLWWVICFYNKIINPITEIVAGKSLRIPDLNQLTRVLQDKNIALSNTFITVE